MSWSDIYPIFSEEQVIDYVDNVNSDDRKILEKWFGVERTINKREGEHVVAVSLFWRNPKAQDEDLPTITRSLMQNAVSLGISKRYDPWTHYVIPLLEGATLLRKSRPDIVFRVYLARDLEFLIEDLVEVGCEVRLMKGSSIRHNPGALWRFLAMEDSRLFTVTDSDRAPKILSDIARTEAINKAGLGFWRVPYLTTLRCHNSPGFYRPIVACHFGGIGGMPMRDLMMAFLWHTMRGTMPDKCIQGLEVCSEIKTDIYGTDWPSYGFDEWLLLATVYPRVACRGMLTFLPDDCDTYNRWFIYDVEYVTWSNPDSQVVFYDSRESCGLIKFETPYVVD